MKTEIEQENDFITVRYDRAFKTVLINDKYKPIMSKIISDILDEPVEVLNFFLNGLPNQNFHPKTNRLYVVVKMTDGKLVIVELKSSYSKFINLRNLIFYTTMHVQVCEIGEINYSEIKLVQINFNFGMDKQLPFKREAHFAYEDNKERFDENFEIIDVNVNKYKDLYYDENIKGDLTHIYLVMLGANEEELVVLGQHDQSVKEIVETMIKLNKDGTFTRLISQEEEDEFFQKLEINDALKKGEEKGIQKGIQKGIKKGIEEGLRKGIQEGIAEVNTRVVKNLLVRNTSIEDIMEITGLNQEEIEQIKNAQ